MRDARLGRVPRELDFVVEGQAEPVARRAARRLGGDVVVHDRFGTATVRAPDAVFDVVSARSECYAAPGALPDVRTGASIEDDLARRDFTVNAIALRLADGELVSVEGAQEDLDGGRAARAARPLVRRRPDAPAAPGPLRRAARVRARPGDRRARGPRD